MDPCRARCSRWRWTAAVAAVSAALFLQSPAHRSHAESPEQKPQVNAGASQARDIHSAHFLIHTDLSAEEARPLVERLETMLRLVSAYWGRPMRGVIECYVVRDLATFPAFPSDPITAAGIVGIRTWGGITLMRTLTDGRRYLAKSVVYASARPEVVQHEAVHAYCHHTFGRIGPVWYSEGMAEMAHYWTEKDSAVHAEPRVIEFLHEHPPKSLDETLSPTHASGDSWQNYASRWALCHFLNYNPNYAGQFWSLGRGLLAGKPVTFEQTFAPVNRQLTFEYSFFLNHIAPGYRVDLCAWDWKKKPVSLEPGRSLTATVAAGRGWQPTGLTVQPGARYEYAATGTWQVSGAPEASGANGDLQGRGRLVGALWKDYQLGPEFDLAVEGILELKSEGHLFLRCRKPWNELAGDSGRLAVQFTLPGQGTPRDKTGAKNPVAATLSRN